MSNTPKYSINERVMVRCHSDDVIGGIPIYIDDCIITEIKTVEVGAELYDPENNNEHFATCQVAGVLYVVDQHYGWIDEDFIFPYHSPGNSFEWQMHELDKPIKILEPA